MSSYFKYNMVGILFNFYVVAQHLQLFGVICLRIVESIV
jgi:hypothetical protein